MDKLIKHSLKSFLIQKIQSIMSIYLSRFFMCAVCAYKSKDHSNMRRHVKTKHMEHTFKCQTCGVTMSQRGQLKTHYMNKHNLSENVANAAANEC